MKPTGIVRRIDDLGRVVIPKEIRRTMRIREGDPLEIYTDKDGEIIFKKYSPVGELTGYAAQICETLNKTTGCAVCMCDRDMIVAMSGTSRRDLIEKRISEDLENLMESRQLYLYKEEDKKIKISEESDKHWIGVSAPIISEGDVSGCLIFVMSEGTSLPKETEYKLAQAVSGFLGKQLEN